MGKRGPQPRPDEELTPCGTLAAYTRHLRRGEEPCERCREARRAYQRRRYKRRPRALAPCGTFAAYLRHIRSGETPCDPCREALNAKERQQRRDEAPQRRERRLARRRRYETLRGRKPRRFAPEIAARDGDRCWYCGLEPLLFAHDWEIDHDVPIARGGTSELANLRLACRTCNRRKHTQTGAEFRSNG